MRASWKLLFVGEPGSGKTTCIEAVSDIAPVSTDVGCTDDLVLRKATTTVALDYGELNLGEQGQLLLYGLPGQARFQYMFDVVKDGLLGIALLVDGHSPDPVAGLRETLDSYAEPCRALPCVLCLNKPVADADALLSRCLAVMSDYDLVAPALHIDARQRADVVRVFELLFLQLQLSDVHISSLEAIDGTTHS